MQHERAVKVEVKEEENPNSLKGTLVCVFSLGVIIIISWFSMYFFYFTR